MRKRILSTLTSGTSGLFASRFAKPAKFASTLLAAPLATLLCGALFGTHSAYAMLACDQDGTNCINYGEVFASSDAYSISISIGNPNNGATSTSGAQNLAPLTDKKAVTHYWLPIELNMSSISKYTVSINATSAALVAKDAGGSTIGTIGAVSGSKSLTQLTNEWGYRSKFTDSASDGFADDDSKTFSAVSTTATAVEDGNQRNGADVEQEYLILDFGTGVDGTVVSGNYGTTVAVSVVATPELITSTMQDLTPEICGAINTGETVTMLDTRDRKRYLVTRMEDGNCWMTQNLAIEGGTTLTSATSDVSSDYTLPASSNSTSNWSDNNTAYMYNGNHQDGVVDTAVTTTNTATSNTGGYYSYVAATAGTGGTNVSSGTAASSICPKGWKLPTKEQFQSLYDAYGSTTSTFNTGFSVALTGGCSPGGCPYANSDAFYWSSSISGDTYGYGLYTSASGTDPQFNNYKKVGRSVRCVYAPTIEDATSMQDLTTNMCSNTTVGTTAALTDSRDGKTYRVTKMSDGNCWMTQNLAISPSGNAITTWDYSAKTTGTVSSVPASVDTFSSSADGVKNWHQGSHVDATNSNLTGAAIDNKSTNTGNYYSWYLAIGQNDGSGSSGEVTTSICPAGWRLPSTDMYNALAKAYNPSNNPSSWDATILGKGSTFGTTTFGTHFGITSANSLPGAYGPSFNSAGTSGFYWASTINNASLARYFALSSGTGVFAQNNNYKYLGASIRCVFVGQ